MRTSLWASPPSSLSLTLSPSYSSRGPGDSWNSLAHPQCRATILGHQRKLWLSLSCIGVLTYNLVANNTSGKKLKTTELMPNFKDGKMEATQRGKITGLRPHSKPRSECYS